MGGVHAGAHGAGTNKNISLFWKNVCEMFLCQKNSIIVVFQVVPAFSFDFVIFTRCFLQVDDLQIAKFPKR